MFIGGIDVGVTRKIENLQARKAAQQNRELKEKQRKHQDEKTFIETKTEDTDDITMTDADEQQYDRGQSSSNDEGGEKDGNSDSDSEESQMRVSLPNLAGAADSFGISDRAAACLATAVLQDVNLVTESDHRLVIDKSKIRRERNKLRKQ